MARAPASRFPRWYGIPARVVLVTFIGTLLSFAVTLLAAIIGTVVAARLRGAHPNMTIAYREIAIPIALIVGAIIFVLALTMEIRHHRRSKTLSAIERMS